MSNESSSKRKLALTVLLGVLIACVLCGCGYLIWQQFQVFRAQQQMQGAAVPDTPDDGG